MEIEIRMKIRIEMNAQRASLNKTETQSDIFYSQQSRKVGTQPPPSNISIYFSTR